jgi:HK97 gp10 family phage protein
MKMDIKIDGVKEIVADLDRLDKEIIDNVQSTLNGGAKKIADRARQKAPKGPTGNLKRSIGSKPMPINLAKFPLVAVAVVDRKIAPHAHLVEYGARGGNMPAHPFLRPAFDSLKASIEKSIESVVSKLIRRHQ